jgi:hypothetical protein
MKLCWNVKKGKVDKEIKYQIGDYNSRSLVLTNSFKINYKEEDR